MTKTKPTYCLPILWVRNSGIVWLEWVLCSGLTEEIKVWAGLGSSLEDRKRILLPDSFRSLAESSPLWLQELRFLFFDIWPLHLQANDGMSNSSYAWNLASPLLPARERCLLQGLILFGLGPPESIKLSPYFKVLKLILCDITIKNNFISFLVLCLLKPNFFSPLWKHSHYHRKFLFQSLHSPATSFY